MRPTMLASLECSLSPVRSGKLVLGQPRPSCSARHDTVPYCTTTRRRNRRSTGKGTRISGPAHTTTPHSVKTFRCRAWPPPQQKFTLLGPSCPDRPLECTPRVTSVTPAFHRHPWNWKTPLVLYELLTRLAQVCLGRFVCVRVCVCMVNSRMQAACG